MPLRLPFRVEWDKQFLNHVNHLRKSIKKPVVILGDLNVALTPIDLARSLLLSLHGDSLSDLLKLVLPDQLKIMEAVDSPKKSVRAFSASSIAASLTPSASSKAISKIVILIGSTLILNSLLLLIFHRSRVHIFASSSPRLDLVLPLATALQFLAPIFTLFEPQL